MTTRGKAGAVPVALGFRAQRGGAVVVGVVVENGEPRAVLSTFLVTANEDDRLALEPYHMAAAMTRGAGGGPTAEARAAVAEGRKRQDTLAAKKLQSIVHRLAGEDFQPKVAALLVNRAGWMTDLLAYSLTFPGHPPVAEGLAVRDALRFAFGKCGLHVAELDEKTLPELAAEKLHLSASALNGRLADLGAPVGRPWKKEQKLACLAAWTAY